MIRFDIDFFVRAQFLKVSNHLLWHFLIFLFWKARGLLKPEDSSHTQSRMANYKNNYIWHFVRTFICGICTKHVLKICLNCFAMKSALEYSARSKVFFDIKLNKLFCLNNEYVCQQIVQNKNVKKYQSKWFETFKNWSSYKKIDLKTY